MPNTVTINSFTPNTKAQSSKVNTNFSNIKTMLDQHEADKTMISVSAVSNTFTCDLSTSKIFKITLGATNTIALTNAEVGKAFMIRISQDATGSRTVTWFGGITWGDGGTVPTLTTTSNKTDVFGFLCVASNQYDGYIISQNL